MSHECKCGLKFGAPATLRLHQNKCNFVAPEVIPEVVPEVIPDTTEPKKRGRPSKK